MHYLKDQTQKPYSWHFIVKLIRQRILFCCHRLPVRENHVFKDYRDNLNVSIVKKEYHMNKFS
jgi:hypothetical protein